MFFHPTPLRGVFTIDWDPRRDDRGLFARAFCAAEFGQHGLCTSFAQANLSVNHHAGTVRGMHFQHPPHAETKVVRCVKGAVYDVIVDIRPASPTYLLWFGAELSEANGRMMYVPPEFAHGYQALTADAAVFYLVSHPYVRDAEGGLRPTDPALGIDWPLGVTTISPKDAAWPLLGPAADVPSGGRNDPSPESRSSRAPTNHS
jgi:dTDP-4-dehydrorhamnose 3,5-epimerase